MDRTALRSTREEESSYFHSVHIYLPPHHAKDDEGGVQSPCAIPSIHISHHTQSRSRHTEPKQHITTATHPSHQQAQHSPLRDRCKAILIQSHPIPSRLIFMSPWTSSPTHIDQNDTRASPPPSHATPICPSRQPQKGSRRHTPPTPQIQADTCRVPLPQSRTPHQSLSPLLTS